jgi:hypothetical protein
VPKRRAWELFHRWRDARQPGRTRSNFHNTIQETCISEGDRCTRSDRLIQPVLLIEGKTAEWSPKTGCESAVHMKRSCQNSLASSHAQTSCQRRIQDRLIFAAGIVRRLVVANRNLSFSADTSCTPLKLLSCQPSLPVVRREVQARECLRQGCRRS